MKSVLLSILLILAVLPVLSSLPLAHASSTTNCTNSTTCLITNQYASGPCILTTTGDKSEQAGVMAAAASGYGTACNGTGYLYAEASAHTAAHSTANARAGISFVDTFTVQNYGQTSTFLTISSYYYLLGALWAGGLGTYFSSGAELEASFKLCGPGFCTNFIQNGGQPWGEECAPSPQISYPPSATAGYCSHNPISFGAGNLTFNQVGNYPLPNAGPGTYTLTFTVTVNATAMVTVFGASSGLSCFYYPVSTCPSAGGPVPSNNCPAIVGASPCYFVQWYNTVYQLTLVNPGSLSDFSMSILSTEYPNTKVYLNQYGGPSFSIWIKGLNGFSGNVNVYVDISPAQRSGVSPPYVYYEEINNGYKPNGTSFYVKDGNAPVSIMVNASPCASQILQGLNECDNGYCVDYSSPWCKTSYNPDPPATPDDYLIRIVGISGSLTHEVDVPFLMPYYYDFAISNVVSSYSNGILQVDATSGNVGNASPIGYIGTQISGSPSWGEVLSYYLDGTLESTVPLCGQTSNGVQGSFLNYDCPPGKIFDYVWNTPTMSASHNITVTAIETAPCCNNLAFFDINPNNNHYAADFGLVAKSNSVLQATPGSSLSTIVTVASLPDFSGTVSISGSTPPGWGLSFNTTSVSLNPGQNLNVTATISVPSSASLGNYTVTITGTSIIGGKSVTHSVNVVAQVVPATLSNNPSSSDWTILKGTWTEKNGVIDATTSSSTTDPIMRSTSTFASDRTVTVRAITITAGSNVYNTAWIGGKYVDSSNSIIMILHTDGKVELQFKQNGVQSSYTTGTTGLSPFVWHTFKMVFSGNTVNAYVDGTLYLTVTNSLVGSLGAANISLESHGAPESQFDSATIT